MTQRHQVAKTADAPARVHEHPLGPVRALHHTPHGSPVPLCCAIDRRGRTCVLMDSVSSLSVVAHVHLCSLAFIVVYPSTLARARVGGWSPLRRLLPCSRPRRCRRRPWGGNRWWTLPGSSRITLGVRPRVAVALCSFAPPAPCVLAPHARVRGLGPCPAPALDLLDLRYRQAARRHPALRTALQGVGW